MKGGTRNYGNKRSCSTCATDIFEAREPLWKQKRLLITAISSISLFIGLYFEFLAEQHLLAQSIFLLVVIIAGYTIMKRGFSSLLKKRFDMNFLMTIAAISAFLIGHGEEGAAIIFLFSIAEFLEDYAAERSKKSIASLLKFAPETAVVKRSGKEIEVHAHEVKINDIVVVKPGDKIPLDGVVISGVSSVNQAPITGESIPVTKTKGSNVFAGTINEEGYLEIKVTKKSDETLLSKITKLVGDAQKQKSKTEKFIDKFTRYYTPTVIVLALGVMTIPTIIFNLPFNEWFYKGLILLVVSCPCALAISTPVSMVSGITSAARNGVLIKGGNYIEEVGKAEVIIFDKTGTLTEGKLEVTDVKPINNLNERRLLQIAASLESLSRHPIAKAVVKKAEKENIPIKNVRLFKSFTGKGVRGKIDGKFLYAGNRKLFQGLKIETPEKRIKKFEMEGKTAILVGDEKKVIGLIAVSDKMREGVIETIKLLKKKRIQPLMLTGDNETVAKAVAKRLGINHFHSELLPEDKIKEVETLTKKHENVIMIGDGVNDAPALAKAKVGIAMGAIGSDVAIETADIALMHDDITKVNYLIELSKKTLMVVKENIVISILIKGSFAILAFPGIVTLWLAVAVGDMGLSLLVILNAMRIALTKLRTKF